MRLSTRLISVPRLPWLVPGLAILSLTLATSLARALSPSDLEGIWYEGDHDLVWAFEDITTAHRYDRGSAVGGVWLLDGNELEFESAGTLERYTVTLSSDRLTLTGLGDLPTYELVRASSGAYWDQVAEVAGRWQRVDEDDLVLTSYGVIKDGFFGDAYFYFRNADTMVVATAGGLRDFGIEHRDGLLRFTTGEGLLFTYVAGPRGFAMVAQQAGIFIWPLGLCSLLALFIVLERLVALRRSKVIPQAMAQSLLKGEVPETGKSGSVAGRILAYFAQHKSDAEQLKAFARLELNRMERGLFILDIVVAAAPLIGLLGTVTGLVQAFDNFSAGGVPDPEVFKNDISLALVTTMLGLGIAIPALVASSYLHRRVDAYAAQMAVGVERLLQVARSNIKADS